MKNSANQKEILNYFKNKATRYDLVDKQSYWQLSDDLLWVSLKIFLNSLPKKFCFFDAGGGTGRWTIKILERYPHSTGVLFDISQDMLAVARKNLIAKKLIDRVKIINGDLMLPFGDLNKFDICFNFHNVLGFVSSPIKVIKNLASILKTNGYLISFVPNLYHLVFFNISLGNISEATNALITHKGKFIEDMPAMHVFTPDLISELYKKNHLDIITLTGFPTAIYPGFQETQIQGSTKGISNLLEDKNCYTKILKIEKKLSNEKDIACRGNNIFIIGKKIL